MSQFAEFQHVLQEFSPLLDSYWPYVVGIVLGILTMISGLSFRAYMGGPDCPSEERIDGKTVVITGASSGIGRETALELARRGGHIVLAVKDEEAGNNVAEEIRAMPNGKADVRVVDLSSLKSVRAFAEDLELDQLDILINNAGIAFHPYEKTEEGFEMHFVTNYLGNVPYANSFFQSVDIATTLDSCTLLAFNSFVSGHFLLTHLLLPKLKAAKQGRIINVSAQAHIASEIHLDDLNLEKNFSPLEAFGQSKLALILMARHMGHVLKDTNVTVNAVNPGRVRGTRHMRRSPISSTYIIKLSMQPWMWLLLKNPVQGAQTSVYAAVSTQLEKSTGKYFSDCDVKTPSANAMDDNLAEILYSKSLLLVQPFVELPEIVTTNE
ncbi:retinol dehydrogenase 13-like isoform X1 [Neodiprion fabricii]|uniref:retinol dehydrogenase 13-like isoform X1 n=1 Tax=Neodiprion fabricii TaxID=2872261 RepID=UPI001ED93C13|nr:retinol dehydrogenase 13-like isoform X1 [Neodiprion fabricii]